MHEHARVVGLVVRRTCHSRPRHEGQKTLRSMGLETHMAHHVTHFKQGIGIGICRLLPSTPRRLLLTELGLLPFQVFWWRQTLKFWNSLAVLPVGSLYHTVCLDSLTDAFQGGACNMASIGSIFAFSGF